MRNSWKAITVTLMLGCLAAGAGWTAATWESQSEAAEENGPIQPVQVVRVTTDGQAQCRIEERIAPGTLVTCFIDVVNPQGDWLPVSRIRDFASHTPTCNLITSPQQIPPTGWVEPDPVNWEVFDVQIVHGYLLRMTFEMPAGNCTFDFGIEQQGTRVHSRMGGNATGRQDNSGRSIKVSANMGI